MDGVSCAEFGMKVVSACWFNSFRGKEYILVAISCSTASGQTSFLFLHRREINCHVLALHLGMALVGLAILSSLTSQHAVRTEGLFTIQLGLRTRVISANKRPSCPMSLNHCLLSDCALLSAVVIVQVSMLLLLGRPATLHCLVGVDLGELSFEKFQLRMASRVG